MYQYHGIRTNQDILPSFDLLSKSGHSLLAKIPSDFLTNRSLFMTKNKVAFYWQSNINIIFSVEEGVLSHWFEHVLAEHLMHLEV